MYWDDSDIEQRLSVVTPPSLRPVSLAEVKRHVLPVDSDDDALLLSYIDAARNLVERQVQWRTLLTTTYRLKLDSFPDLIRLPLPPLQSVTSITYVDEDGATQTLASSLYDVDTTAEPGVIVPGYGDSWPSVLSHRNSVTVTFVAGYTTPERIPASTRTGITQLVSHWFDNREPVVTGTIATKIPLHVEVLLNVESLRAVA